MRSSLVFIGLLFSIPCFASLANNKIQEAAYILNIDKDTAKAKELFDLALNYQGATIREKLNAHLYLAKIAEARLDTQGIVKHYGFLKNNSENSSLAYIAADKEKQFAATNEKVKISSEKILYEQKNTTYQEIKSDQVSNCFAEGELLAGRIVVYNCPNKNSLHLISSQQGLEIGNIPYSDVPAKVFLAFDGLFLYCKNWLYFHRLGEDLKNYAWRKPALEVQDIEDVGDKIYVLDISGKISLLNKNSGYLISVAKSDGENFFSPGIGLIGTYQKNGGISVFDTLLNNLWNYQIDGEISEAPVIKSDSVIFNLQNGNSEILNTRHYQKFTFSASNNIDSLLALESGNAFAWYSIAEQKKNDSAWKRAVIYGARMQDFSQFVFSRYAEKIGAKWVRYLPLSSKMLYPQMFSDANWLFVSDEGSQSLFKFSLETGNFGGEILLPRDREYTVRDNEPPWLILSSGDGLSQFSLREQKSVSIETYGKPFSFLRSKDSIYIGFWNGFVLKYFIPKMRLEWSRRVSSAPVLLSAGENGIYSFSQGKVSLLSKTRSPQDINLGTNAATYFKYKNGMFAIASEDGDVRVFSEKEDFKQQGAFSARSQIVSFELLENKGKTYALVGGVNQTFSLYEIPSGALVWTFNSKGSSYQPVVHGSHIWLDQDGSIAAIDINTGKVAKRYPIFGSGASISIYGNTLYCATPQKLLYAFPLANYL